MYEEYFGFHTRPFSITPDPRFFYDTPSYREAFATLRYGIEARKGLIVITGAAGLGKTRLVKDFMQRAEVTIGTAFISNPKLTAAEFLPFVLNELRITSTTQDRAAMTLQLKEYLVERFKKHHHVALLVDEAQQLNNELFEELRLLSNLETNEEKLIQIVLLGQPELEERLDQPELRQLKQRVAIRCRLLPLTDREVYPYILSRLETAGFAGKALFDPKAVEKIALYSKGIPRLINVLCDNALLNCYACSKSKVSAEIVEETALDLQLTAQASKKQLSATAPLETVGKRRILKEANPSASVLQAPLEDFADFPMAGEQRRTPIRRQRRLAGLATGFVFGILAAAGGGAIVYSQSYRDYLLQTAARIWDETNWRETVKTGAAALGALLADSSKELKDAQPIASEMPPLSTQQAEGSSLEANATPSLEASDPGASQSADVADRTEEKLSLKNENKDESTTKAAAARTSKKSESDRLEFDIYRAIAKRAIRGVEVSVVDGTAFLRGRVDTENQKIAAAKAASSVPGVKHIRDQIIVNDNVAS
ncbi:MAG TPA: AAA family ATPase [Candidatus Binatia bacterium]|nr:AAA family ATPase [Candidatus Binatia bacterium]